MPSFLGTGESYEGAWHVEGMSHEEIVATVDFILDRDEELVDGDIEFKRAFLEKEADVFFHFAIRQDLCFKVALFLCLKCLNQRTARSPLRLRSLTTILHGIWFFHRIGLTDPAK